MTKPTKYRLITAGLYIGGIYTLGFSTTNVILLWTVCLYLLGEVHTQRQEINGIIGALLDPQDKKEVKDIQRGVP